MHHYLLIYDLAPDYMERRPEFRKEHLALAWQASERGELSTQPREQWDEPSTSPHHALTSALSDLELVRRTLSQLRR